MARCLTSKRLRAALYAAANGMCQSCGVSLPSKWHADHVIPWSVSKRTNVHEMKALCPKCNLKKGSRVVEYRKHQQEMKEIAEKIATCRKKFRMLCHVVCGGGKSWMPYILMNELPLSLRLCWVVPRSALQEQAVGETVGNHGIILRDAGNETDPCRGHRGVVVTQQSFSLNPELWRDEFKRHSYVLVVDEPHHAKVSFKGESNSLASAVAMTEEHCFGVVYMTGTLTTGDNRMIYGVDYIDSPTGKGVYPVESGFDYYIRYSRADAREENAIVPIKFFHHDGPVKWESLRLGVEVETKLSEASREQESNAIWTALSTQMATGLFDRGYKHWKQRGQSLLVLCNTQSKAREYHERLLRLGEKSFLAVTENTEASDSIREFKKTPNGCLVTCAMAYEGLDHKPLSHVICLTHIRSAPWIEQALARVWRSSPGKTDCYAFVPDDPRMNRVIDEIKAEEPDVKRPNDGGGGGGGPGGNDDAIPIDGQHADTRFSSLDEDVRAAIFNQKQLAAIDALKQLGLGEESEAVQSVIHALSGVDNPSMNGGVTPKQREKALRCKIADLCRKIDNDRELDFGTTQKSLIRKTKKSTSDMTESELREVLAYVENVVS
jgi:superfamily II DNA or RNA helicase